MEFVCAGVEAKAVLMSEEPKSPGGVTIYFAVLSAKNLPTVESSCCGGPSVNPYARFSFKNVHGTEIWCVGSFVE